MKKLLMVMLFLSSLSFQIQAEESVTEGETSKPKKCEVTNQDGRNTTPVQVSTDQVPDTKESTDSNKQ